MMPFQNDSKENSAEMGMTKPTVLEKKIMTNQLITRFNCRFQTSIDLSSRPVRVCTGMARQAWQNMARQTW